jgi:tRNA pseudouridine38-40 synthase
VKDQEKVHCEGAGRTDTGVHAAAQSAHVLLENDLLYPDVLVPKLNQLLPADIRVLRWERAPDDFHARFSARAREYRYYVSLSSSYPPFCQDYVLAYPYPLDQERLRASLRFFPGRRDFTTFSNSDENQDPVRFVRAFRFRVRNGLLVFSILADSFLKGMVRNIIGTVLKVNRDRQNPRIIGELFRLKDNRYCGWKIDAKGLFLHRVLY